MFHRKEGHEGIKDSSLWEGISHAPDAQRAGREELFLGWPQR